MNVVQDFLRKEALKSKELVSTDHVLIDKVFMIPLRACTLIRSEPYSGATALALELVSSLTNKGRPVFYIDISNSLFFHRLKGIDLSKLYIINAAILLPLELEDLMKSILQQIPTAVFILDNPHFFTSCWNKRTLVALLRRIRECYKEVTFISLQRKGYAEKIWSNVIDLEKGKNIYENEEEEDSVHRGHYLLLHNANDGSYSKVYVDYGLGRISKAYEYVYLQLLSGDKQPGSIFELDGIKVQGSKKFIHEYNKRALNGDVTN